MMVCLDERVRRGHVGYGEGWNIKAVTQKASNLKTHCPKCLEVGITYRSRDYAICKKCNWEGVVK